MEANWMRQRCEGIVRSMTLCNRFQSYKNEIQILKGRINCWNETNLPGDHFTSIFQVTSTKFVTCNFSNLDTFVI